MKNNKNKNCSTKNVEKGLPAYGVEILSVVNVN